MPEGGEWWSISGEDLMAMLQRVDKGEDPMSVYIEAYANARLSEAEDA